MKKLIFTLLFLLVTLLFLTSCGSGETQTEAETETETEIMSWEAADIPEYQRPLREVADKALIAKFGVADFSPFQIEVSPQRDGGHCVKYTLYICGYSTNDVYWVYLTPENELDRAVEAYGKFQYTKFLKTATEQAVRAAEERLSAKSGEENRFHFYLEIDDEGYLCLYTEVIVDLEVPNEWGVDHEHIFYSERICR